MTTNTFTAQIGAGAANAATYGAPVSPQSAHLTRYSFLFLVDVSGSTGLGGAAADIHAINDILGGVTAYLRAPPSGSRLEDLIDQIDVSVIAYSDDPKIENNWTAVASLPSAYTLTPLLGTAMGKAFEYALEHIGKRLLYLKSQNTPCGMPHIFHFTDGAPTDMPIGSPRWNEIASRLGNVGTVINPERPRATIVHLISPNGCTSNAHSSLVPDETGAKLTGQQALSRLTDPKSVYAMTKGPTVIEDVVTMVTRTVTSITAFGVDPHTAAAQAAQNSSSIKTTYGAAP